MVKAVVKRLDGSEQVIYALDWDGLFAKMGNGNVQSIYANKITAADIRQGRDEIRY